MLRWLFSCFALSTLLFVSPESQAFDFQKLIPSGGKRKSQSPTSLKFRACKAETTLEGSYQYCTHLARSSLLTERDIHKCGRQAIGPGPFKDCLDQVLAAKRLRLEVDRMVDELTSEPPAPATSDAASAPM